MRRGSEREIRRHRGNGEGNLTIGLPPHTPPPGLAGGGPDRPNYNAPCERATPGPTVLIIGCPGLSIPVLARVAPAGLQGIEEEEEGQEEKREQEKEEAEQDRMQKNKRERAVQGERREGVGDRKRKKVKRQ